MKRILPIFACTVLLGACNTSYNYYADDVERGPSEEFNAFGTVLRMAGMSPTVQAPVDQSTPRAPLAMPPSTELPAPESGDPAELVGAAWPNDPDAAEAARQKAVAEAGATTAAYENSIKQSEDARLSPEEIQAGRMAGAVNRGGRPADPINNIGSEQFRLSPRELAKTFMPKREGREVLTDDGQAVERRYLIEPPTTYREPVETAVLPDKKDIENSEWVKKRIYRQDDRKPPRLQK